MCELDFNSAYIFIMEDSLREKRRNLSRINTGTVRNLLAQVANHKSRSAFGSGTLRTITLPYLFVCLFIAFLIIVMILNFYELFFFQLEDFLSPVIVNSRFICSMSNKV